MEKQQKVSNVARTAREFKDRMVENDDVKDVLNRLHKYLGILEKRPGGDVELERLRKMLDGKL
jgi:hypothetical protein